MGAANVRRRGVGSPELRDSRALPGGRTPGADGIGGCSTSVWPGRGHSEETSAVPAAVHHRRACPAHACSHRGARPAHDRGLRPAYQ